MEEYAARFFMLIQQATRLDAIDSLNQLRVSSFPNQKPAYQRATVRDYQKMAQPRVSATPERVKRDSQRLMAILGIKKK